MNKLTKGFLALLVAASAIGPAKSQNNQQNSNEQKAQTELLTSPILDGHEVYYRGVARSCGLDEKTMRFHDDFYVSDNGVLCCDSKFTFGVVVENGKLIFFEYLNNKRKEIQDTELKNIIFGVIKTVLRNEKDSKIYNAITSYSNAQSYYNANNRAGSVCYHIDENGALEIRGDYKPVKGVSYPVAIPKMDEQGYYYLGDQRGPNMQGVRTSVNLELNTRDKWVLICVYLDLAENRDINSLTDGEILFITKYKQFLKKYELELDKDNNIRICGARTVNENTNTGYNR